jgi:hypothetical protein
MFGWFRSKPTCPVDDKTRAWVDKRWDWLENQFGLERLRHVTVILPRPEFFPDSYNGTEADVRRMLDRVCEYMEIDPTTVKLNLYEERKPMFDGQHHGSAGQYQRQGGKFRISIEASTLDDALGLVGTMAHELGHVHLLGHRRISEAVEDHEPLTDLLTVFLGLGVFTANSVVQESNWTSGQFSGWSMGRRGYLGMPVYGYAFARFARARDEDGSEWASELRLDVRSAFLDAMRFLDHESSSAKE